MNRSTASGDTLAASTGKSLLMWVLFAGLSLAVLASALLQIDQSVRAPGQIIAGSRTQVIQAADGGVLSDIRVREGESVEAGQVLAVLEKERPAASVAESEARIAALQIALVRAKAEAEEKTPTLSGEFEAHQAFIEAQRQLFDQRLRAKQDELRGIDSLLESQRLSLAMAEEELALNETLFASGDVSRVELLRSRRQVLELQSRIHEATSRRHAVRNKYRQEARQEIAKIEEELSSAEYKLAERKSVLDHTDIVAPRAGVVKYLRVSTVGGVLRAGDELMQISPSNDDLVIEIKINPVDIGQLTVGMPVGVRLDAFDYTRYGVLRGELSYLSSDTLSEQGGDGQTAVYYRGQVRLPPAALSDNPRFSSVVLKPGMTATVDILTGKRSVLGYLMKPVLRGFSGALRES
jgi:adhesin transport system membrane fusion protein